MPDFGRVRQTDFAALLRISAEVADLPVNVTARRQHILNSFCDLMGARMASVFDAVAQADEPGPDGLALVGSLTSVRTSAAQHGMLHEFLSIPRTELRDPVEMGLTRTVMTRGTVLRDDFTTGTHWHNSAYYNQLLRQLRVDDQISCAVPLANGGWAGMCLMRDPGDSPFTERDREVLAMFHLHASHLYGVKDASLDRVTANLPPRHRLILQQMLEGDGDKQIALKLGLSIHTVHTYAKQLYQKLGVSGRSELFAKLRSPTA